MGQRSYFCIIFKPQLLSEGHTSQRLPFIYRLVRPQLRSAIGTLYLAFVNFNYN